MFDNLGVQWAGTLLGCLAAILVPIPVLFYLYGAKLREKSKFAPTMKRKPPPEDDTSDDDHHDGNDFVALSATKSTAHAPTVRSRNSARNANADEADVEKGEQETIANTASNAGANGSAVANVETANAKEAKKE